MTAPDDLVERLEYATKADTGTGYLKRAALWREAAAAITALRERVAELEAENKERGEIIENHREARKVLERENARLEHAAGYALNRALACERDALRADLERYVAQENKNDAVR